MTSTQPAVITIAGRYLWRNGKRHIIKGVVYQRARRLGPPTDGLADVHIDDIRRDLIVFRDLGINAILVYKIDPNLQHDEAMQLLESAGICVLIGAGDHENRSVINRVKPRQSYTPSVQRHFQVVATCMAKYNNTLGIVIANDLINQYSAEKELVLETCEILVQAIGELKHFMQLQHEKNGQRFLPICIADLYWSRTKTSTFDYLTGTELDGSNVGSKPDFYCVNHYSSSSSPSEEGTNLNPSGQPQWNLIHTLPQLTQQGSDIPILLSEYSGNNMRTPRSFHETVDLYSNAVPAGAKTPMLDVLSGGFVYEFFEAANRYGLVKVVEDNSRTLDMLPDYHQLKSQLDRSRRPD